MTATNLPRAAGAFVALACGCAVQLRAPEPDLPDRKPVQPAPMLSHLAAVARIPHATLGRFAENHLDKGQSGTETMGVLHANWQVARDGPVTVRGDERGRLCFVTMFKGKTEASALGQRLDRELRGQMNACARPELDAGATLRMRDPDVRVLLDRSSVGGPVGFVLDAILGKLQAIAGDAALTRLRELAVPTLDALGPLQAMLQAPIGLPDKACIKLRPQSVRVTQPMIDPTALRMGASVAALPTGEQPCTDGADPTAFAGKLPFAVVDHLETPKTFLLLPVAMSLDALQKPMAEEMARIGAMKTDQGWVKVTGMRLSTARGALLVHAAIEGEIQDRFLFVPIRRPVKGEVLVWGNPEVDREGVRLANLNLELHTDDRLVAMGAALKHSQLVEVVARHARIPRARIDDMAKKALEAFSQGIMVGRERVPAAAQVEQLNVESVSAAGQRIDVLVRFVGQVVIGETARN
ncbi:MAG: DUF4403 family protein [Deltaproteobacteria bacterium]|nr:DUF4403 family protein [Deltaproteobacteria bacterium]